MHNVDKLNKLIKELDLKGYTVLSEMVNMEEGKVILKTYKEDMHIGDYVITGTLLEKWEIWYFIKYIDKDFENKEFERFLPGINWSKYLR